MDTKRLLKNKIIYCVTIFAIGLFFLGYSNANAATLKINSSSGTLSSGEKMTLNVVLNSEGVSVNNAEATIKFPTDLIEIVSISKNGSIFSLWVEEPYFSNSSGVITLNGGVPTPGFNGSNGPVVSIIARAKKVGQAEFVFSSAAVRANDGLGTDVLNTKQGKIITIINKEKPADIVSELPGPTLQILSLTHPNQNQWYKDKSPVFKWTIPAGADAIQTGIDANTAGAPRVIYSPAIREKTVKDLKDGVWYFKARARKGGVWGASDTYIVRVDTTAPQKKDVVFAYDDNAKVLNITADIQDITSGIDHYEIFINDALAKTVSAKEFISGKYSFAPNTERDNVVKLIAIDRAGNSVEALGTFSAIVGIIAPQLESIPSTISKDEQLLIRGVTQNSNTDVTVNIKHNDDESIFLKAKSYSDGSFFVLTPKLKSGNYDIWAEIDSRDGKVSSTHLYTEVTSQLIIFSSFSITALALILGIILLLMMGAYHLGLHHNGKFQHKIKMRKALVKGDDSKVLYLLKKRLEKHLGILQNIRRGRILTKEEKEIKEAVEGDLDEIDKAMEG